VLVHEEWSKFQEYSWDGKMEYFSPELLVKIHDRSKSSNDFGQVMSEKRVNILYNCVQKCKTVIEQRRHEILTTNAPR
jgi:hypothetical protein